jgi:hypothetical protein
MMIIENGYAWRNPVALDAFKKLQAMIAENNASLAGRPATATAIAEFMSPAEMRRRQDSIAAANEPLAQRAAKLLSEWASPIVEVGKGQVFIPPISQKS